LNEVEVDHTHDNCDVDPCDYCKDMQDLEEDFDLEDDM